MRRRVVWQRAAVASAAALALFVAGSARPDLPVEAIGQVETLAVPPEPHWIWVSDPLLERIALVDLESGRTLGMIDGGWGITTGFFSRDGREIYVPETH